MTHEYIDRKLEHLWEMGVKLPCISCAHRYTCDRSYFLKTGFGKYRCSRYISELTKLTPPEVEECENPK